MDRRSSTGKAMRRAPSTSTTLSSVSCAPSDGVAGKPGSTRGMPIMAEHPQGQRFVIVPWYSASNGKLRITPSLSLMVLKNPA